MCAGYCGGFKALSEALSLFNPHTHAVTSRLLSTLFQVRKLLYGQWSLHDTTAAVAAATAHLSFTEGNQRIHNDRSIAQLAQSLLMLKHRMLANVFKVKPTLTKTMCIKWSYLAGPGIFEKCNTGTSHLLFTSGMIYKNCGFTA